MVQYAFNHMKIAATSKTVLAHMGLSLYVIATMGLTVPATSEFYSCLSSTRCAMTEFLFSPYLDVNVPLPSLAPTTKSSSSTFDMNWLEPPTRPVPEGIKALTLAFATGECGNEHWNGVAGQAIADSNIKLFQRNGIDYVISTGGTAGIFTCSSEQGMEKFIARYGSRHLLGVDFDIESGQSEMDIKNLLTQAQHATRLHPHLRLSFTLATQVSAEDGKATLNSLGKQVMKAISEVGLKNYFINLMVMNYGEAKPDNCVVEFSRCNMAASAILVAENFSREFSVPLRRIELTPMIGVNDVTDNIFSLNDARTLGRFVTTNGLGGLHYWSLNRDQPCLSGLTALSPTCSSLAGTNGLEFGLIFANNFR